MLSEREVTAAIGSTAYGDGGDKVGTVEHFFVDDRTGEPTWVAVSTGLLGTRHSIAPARGASWADGRLHLPVPADAVKNAPAVSGNHLDPGQEEELRRHYGLGGAATTPAAGTATTDISAIDTTTTDTATTGTATTGTATGTGGTTGTTSADDTVVLPATPPVPDSTQPRHAERVSTDGAMTRSEERLRVGTERVPARRVRVVKYVVTEEVQVTVPIRREEIRLEEVPLGTVGAGPDDTVGSGSPTPAGTGTGELPGEIILHTERPVVTVEVVPTERVRLRIERVEGQETVTEQVRRERIAVDEDVVPGRGSDLPG